MRISDWSSDVCSSDLVRNAGRRGRRTYSHFWPAGRLSIGRKALLLRARRLAGAIQRCDAGAETRTFRYRAAELLWHRQSLLARQSESRRRYRPGIVMLEHDADHAQVPDYTDAGVVGIRLECFTR